MDLEHISQYILPILILLFYLFAGRKKPKPVQKDLPPPQEEEPFYTPPPAPQKKRIEKPKSLPPVQRTFSRYESQITDRHVDNAIENRSFSSSIAESKSLISRGLSDRIDMDEAYAIKPRHRNSRGRALLNKLPTLKDAVILQEIFKRPDDF